MNINNEAPIYVIKDSNLYLDIIKSLNYIMDYHNNIICWTSIDNARQYLNYHGLDDCCVVVQTTVASISSELNNKKITAGIKVINTIHFEK